MLIREADLLDRAHAAGVLTDGTPIAAGELRRLLCDAELVPVVLGGASEILDLGRGRRLASAAQRFAIGLRDGHCAFPGRAVPMHRCEIHHITPWQQGGPTDLDNLVALCVRHHQLCEPGPPEIDGDGYARAPDQWRVSPRTGRSPEFVPPFAWQKAHPDPPTDPPGQIHAVTLFDQDSEKLASSAQLSTSDPSSIQTRLAIDRLRWSSVGEARVALRAAAQRT